MSAAGHQLQPGNCYCRQKGHCNNDTWCMSISAMLVTTGNRSTEAKMEKELEATRLSSCRPQYKSCIVFREKAVVRRKGLNYLFEQCSTLKC